MGELMNAGMMPYL